MPLLIRHKRLFIELAGARRLAAFVALTLLTGLADGIGLALVVPLLEIGVGSNAAPSAVSQVFADTLAAAGLTPTLPLLVLILIVVFAVKALFNFLTQTTVAFMQVSLRERLRMAVVDHALGARLPHVLRTRVGTLSNLFTAELNGTVQNMLALAMLAGAGVLFAIYVTGALVADWRSGVAALIVAALVQTVFVGVNRRTRALSRNISDRNARIMDLALQSFNNIKFLKATHTHARLRDRLQGITDERRAFQKWQEALKTLVHVAMEPFAIAVIAAFVLFSVAVRGETLATALLPMLFLYRAVGRAGEVQMAWCRFCATAGPVDAFETARRALAEEHESFPALACPPLRRAITLTGVSYGYDEASDTPVLKDVSLEIPARGLVGITGPTGAGKTTCVDILCGLLRPGAGRAAWDERDYAEIDLTSLRARIGYVTQDTVMFNDTIANNITLWETQGAAATRQTRLREAAEAACCLDFIESCEDGFETVVGERSLRLSGGQRQRLAIARELYRDPEVLILDEGTSALDAETEAAIQATLDALRARKTVIVIAHRLSTLRRCGLIFVFDKGRLIESGDWDTLTGREGGWLARAAALQKAV